MKVKKFKGNLFLVFLKCSSIFMELNCSNKDKKLIIGIYNVCELSLCRLSLSQWGKQPQQDIFIKKHHVHAWGLFFNSLFKFIW